MGNFIFDTAMADGALIAVCGLCEDGAENDINNALEKLKNMNFGNGSINSRLPEILAEALTDFGDKIILAGAIVDAGKTGCVIVDNGFKPLDGKTTANGFMVCTKENMVFASETPDKQIGKVFQNAETMDDFIELYNQLIRSGSKFITVSAYGAAAKSDIVFLSETKQRAEEPADYFGIKRIGIMGGTFDPIHNGHLIAAETVREALNLEKVIFMPTGSTSYKVGRSSNVHRYKMTCLAAKTNKYFCVSSIETEKKTIAYTVDTVAELREKCDADAKLYFIIGADVMETIMGWKGFDRLAGMCEFALVTRPGYNGMGLAAIGRLRERGGKVRLIEAPALDISSSYIRRAQREGRSVKYLLPESVEDFMRLHRLYAEEEQKNDLADILLRL
ncbi:MAG: nicotinate-nucleotide adenylyltransferase [Clostridiales bacterium]|nr:nicotinate-nucleotide adenylyltransferase [Clostridiales bacterium]